MAYVFGFPKDVTNLIYDMRDWKLEDVKQNNGTPSCLALKSFTIKQIIILTPQPLTRSACNAKIPLLAF